MSEEAFKKGYERPTGPQGRLPARSDAGEAGMSEEAFKKSDGTTMGRLR